MVVLVGYGTRDPQPPARAFEARADRHAPSARLLDSPRRRPVQRHSVLMATKQMPRGVELRTDSEGRPAYRVRVRRGGKSQTATFPTIEGALAWRAQAVAAARGEAPAPARPTRSDPMPADGA